MFVLKNYMSARSRGRLPYPFMVLGAGRASPSSRPTRSAHETAAPACRSMDCMMRGVEPEPSRDPSPRSPSTHGRFFGRQHWTPWLSQIPIRNSVKQSTVADLFQITAPSNPAESTVDFFLLTGDLPMGFRG